MNRSYTLIFLLLTFGACEDSIRFEEPQPSHQNDLKRIPKQLRGTYFSASDSTYLTIDEQTIVDWAAFDFRTLRDSVAIDSADIIEESIDYCKVADGRYALEFKFFGDSVLVNYSYKDTLFKISDRHILRRFRGHYFLNYRRSETNWKVRRLTRNKQELSFSKIRVPEDIELLKEITEVKVIRSNDHKVTGYKLKPSKKELKKLMKLRFSDTQTYEIIK